VLGGPPPVHEVGDTAARRLFGESGGEFISTAIAIALISAVSAMVMAGPRVYAAMAEDGVLPRFLARRTRRGVPLNAVALQGALAITFVVVAELGELIRYVGFTLSIFAGLTVAAVFILRSKYPDAARPHRTIGYPVTPALFLAATAWIALAQMNANPKEASWTIATLGIGVAAYLWLVPKQKQKPAALDD
jgi:APA family basic amino acid/polyamine antiporter